MNKARVEAITDGIVAIAATIMVLELGIPSVNGWAGLLEIRHTFLAYVISFSMIYIVWSMHHDLMEKAEILSRRTFLVNGVWIFTMTLVPFTTAWVGSAPEASLPEFLYAMNLLLWSAAFQWLDYQIRVDNPGAPRDSSTALPSRALLYGGFALCMGLSWFRPELCLYMIGIVTAVMGVALFADKK